MTGPKAVFDCATRWRAGRTLPSLLALLCAALLLAQAGCTQNRRPAPVIDRYPEASKPAVKPNPDASTTEAAKPGIYVVRKGDTLYSVALEHNVDYRELAVWNDIDPNQVIRIGQQLRILPPAGGAVTAPLKSAAPTAPLATSSSPPASPQPGNTRAPPFSSGTASAIKTQPRASKVPYSDQTLARLMAEPGAKAPPLPKTEPPAKPESSAPQPPAAGAKAPTEAAAAAEADEERVDWGWPAEGKIVSGFNESDNLKGVDIAGKLGQSVIASAPGRVVYSGAGLRGYGKLVIIRHNKTYLSAYAHNSQILVKEGQAVAKGQKIAEMGNSDADQIKLHFEIRRLGKPVDPIKYLPNAKS